jgi:hypothetical protein
MEDPENFLNDLTNICKSRADKKKEEYYKRIKDKKMKNKKIKKSKEQEEREEKERRELDGEEIPQSIEKNGNGIHSEEARRKGNK